MLRRVTECGNCERRTRNDVDMISSWHGRPHNCWRAQIRSCSILNLLPPPNALSSFLTQVPNLATYSSISLHSDLPFQRKDKFHTNTDQESRTSLISHSNIYAFTKQTECYQTLPEISVYELQILVNKNKYLLHFWDCDKNPFVISLYKLFKELSSSEP